MNILNATKALAEGDEHYLMPDGSRATCALDGMTYEYDPTGKRGAPLCTFKDKPGAAYLNRCKDDQNESDSNWQTNHSPDAIATKEVQAIADAELKDLEDTDRNMARISEELIDILISSGTIKMTDFPEETQDVINDQKAKAVKARKPL